MDWASCQRAVSDRILGDIEATLHGVYRKATETDATHVQFGSWGLLDKLSEIIPEENP